MTGFFQILRQMPGHIARSGKSNPEIFHFSCFPVQITTKDWLPFCFLSLLLKNFFEGRKHGLFPERNHSLRRRIAG
jgi:hypothetical protein